MRLDTIQGGHAYGGVAAQLLRNDFNVNSLRTCDVLRKDEWKHFDEQVVNVAQQRLVGIADLERRGLVLNITNGLGSTVLEYEDMSDIEAAEMNMSGVTRARNDRVEYDINYLPLPIISKPSQINIRVLNASRTRGMPLDTTMAERAARKVAEYSESLLFTGASTYTYGGGTIYGYMDFPFRNTGSLTANWDDSAATGETILADVLNMKQDSINARHYGPFVLYIPTAYEKVLDDDFKSNSDKSIRERLMQINNLDSIVVADYLTADNVLLVEMAAETVRLVKGLPIQTVQWETEGGMIFHFKVMTIMVPQLRADQDDRSGITHYS